jgi:hypothetical protein
MAQAYTAQTYDRGTEETSEAYADGMTGWTGWVAFAGVMMVIAGSLQATYGFIALVNDEWVVWGNRASVYLDLTTWGWVHLLGGVVVALAGVGVFSGNVLARAVGVVVATLSLIVNFLFIPAYPIWAITVVVVQLLVIWALTAHGGEMRRR